MSSISAATQSSARSRSGRALRRCSFPPDGSPKAGLKKASSRLQKIALVIQGQYLASYIILQF